MSENLKCSHCNKPATVHLTQIVNNKIIKVDLCESCAQAKGVTDSEGYSLADLLSKTNLTPQKGEASTRITCPDCGMTTKDFRQTGRLGCAACYGSFATYLQPALEDMHVGTAHKGKIPKAALSRQSSLSKLHDLENSLNLAIAEEAYEDAAKFRDEIQAYKKAVQYESISHD